MRMYISYIHKYLIGGFNPSENYESVGTIIHRIWINKKSSKPPTRYIYIYIIVYIYIYIYDMHMIAYVPWTNHQPARGLCVALFATRYGFNSRSSQNWGPGQVAKESLVGSSGPMKPTARICISLPFFTCETWKEVDLPDPLEQKWWTPPHNWWTRSNMYLNEWIQGGASPTQF